jgi:hypothetical protein
MWQQRSINLLLRSVIGIIHVPDRSRGDSLLFFTKISENYSAQRSVFGSTVSWKLSTTHQLENEDSIFNTISVMSKRIKIEFKAGSFAEYERVPACREHQNESDDGSFTGVATITKISGASSSFVTYHGDILRDGMQGHGIMIWSDQHRYEGSFKSNLKDGHGIEVFDNGDRFEGEFKCGRRIGGLYTLADGKKFLQTYDGEGKMIMNSEG